MLSFFVITSLILLAALVAVGLRIMAVADDILALITQTQADLATLIAQKNASIPPQQTAAIQAGVQALDDAIKAAITP